MSFIIQIKNHDLQLIFNQENEVFNFVLNHFITKIITIHNIKINNQLFGDLKYDLNDIIIKKYNNFGTYKYDIILFSFDNFNFYYEKTKISHDFLPPQKKVSKTAKTRPQFSKFTTIFGS